MNEPRLRNQSTRADAERRSIADALSSEVRMPLAALRAALESLARDGEPDERRARVLEAAALELGLLSHKVGSLMEAALGAPVGTNGFRIGELRTCFQRVLTTDAAESVTVACEDPWAAVSIDPARFAGALAGLVESLVREGVPVLVRMKYDHGLAVRVLAEETARRGSIAHRSHEGMRIAFAERELEALGLRLAWRITQNGGTHVALRQDDRPAFGGVA